MVQSKSSFVFQCVIMEFSDNATIQHGKPNGLLQWSIVDLDLLSICPSITYYV